LRQAFPLGVDGVRLRRVRATVGNRSPRTSVNAPFEAVGKVARSEMETAPEIALRNPDGVSRLTAEVLSTVRGSAGVRKMRSRMRIKARTSGGFPLGPSHEKLP
jgi:hypothetical protein